MQDQLFRAAHVMLEMNLERFYAVLWSHTAWTVGSRSGVTDPLKGLRGSQDHISRSSVQLLTSSICIAVMRVRTFLSAVSKSCYNIIRIGTNLICIIQSFTNYHYKVLLIGFTSHSMMNWRVSDLLFSQDENVIDKRLEYLACASWKTDHDYSTVGKKRRRPIFDMAWVLII